MQLAAMGAIDADFADEAPARIRLHQEAYDALVDSLLQHVLAAKVQKEVGGAQAPGIALAVESSGDVGAQGRPQADARHSIIVDLQRHVAPEASTAWCQAYEVLHAYGTKILPPNDAEAPVLNTVHIGHSAPAWAFATNHFLASHAELHSRRTKWWWRGLTDNPHFEGHEAALDWNELENALFCHYPDNWFHGQDGSGRIILGTTWRVEKFWEWVWRGPCASQQSTAARLPHLVTASPSSAFVALGRPIRELALATLICAVGILRVGGCLCQSFQHPEVGASFCTFVMLLALFFEHVELVRPDIDTPGVEVMVVALRFRGIQSALTQGLVLMLRRVVACKQSTAFLDQWAKSADEYFQRRLLQWLSLKKDSHQYTGAASLMGYAGRMKMSRIPEQSHLMWTCWPDSLRRQADRYATEALFAQLRPDAGISDSLCVHSSGFGYSRKCRWLAAQAATELRSESTSHVQPPLQKRARGMSQPGLPSTDGDAEGFAHVMDGTLPVHTALHATRLANAPHKDQDRRKVQASLVGTAHAKVGCGEQEQDGRTKWFALNANNLTHRSLLRHLSSDTSALHTARGNWWRYSEGTPPWLFASSPYAPAQVLHSAILERSNAPAPARLEDTVWQRSSGEVPPLMLASLVRAILMCLPEKAQAQRQSLSYTHVCYIPSADVAAAGSGSADKTSQATSWLAERMSIEATTLRLPALDQAPPASDLLRLCLGGDRSERDFEMVVLDPTPSEHGDRWHEIAWTELDFTARRHLIGTALVGLRVLGTGGDLFLRLRSSYSRFVAGLFMLLSVAFERLALVRSGVTPAWRGERWLVCNGFAQSERCRAHAPALQALLSGLWDQLIGAPPGWTVAQLLPLGFICTAASGVRDFLATANEEALNAELRCWSMADRGAGGHVEAFQDTCSVLQYLSRMKLKPYLFPGMSNRVLVGLYFGTFDPMHENHFRVAVCALTVCGLKRVILVPNPSSNPYKPSCSSMSQRIRCIQARIRHAESTGEIQAGQVLVRVVAGSANWPERENLAQFCEREEFSESPATAEVVFLLGEDSLSKSLRQAAGKHKNSGIFQLKTRPRGIIVFPRGGNAEGILASIPEALRQWVSVAPYQDLVSGLSSSALRQTLQAKPDPPSVEAMHPAVWAILQQDGNGESAEPEAVEQLATETRSSSLTAATDELATEGCAASSHCVRSQDPRLHYDLQTQQSRQQRCESLTVKLRNFNSFAKAVLLEHCLCEVRAQAGGVGMPIAVLDLGCGKGGDLKKFANSGVTQFCGVDISAAALEEMVRRIQATVRDMRRAKHGLLGEAGLPLREVSIIQADCWREDLPHLLDCHVRYGTARLQGLGQAWFHVVSSQMACHYAFESEQSVNVLLRNVSERLCDGGVFVGTVPDATRIVAAQLEAFANKGELRVGNNLFQIEFEPSQWEKVASQLPLWQTVGTSTAGGGVFGVMYKYTLRDAVEGCYEPLVHFETLRQMAARHGLVLHLGPKPLADIALQAHGDGELGRLRRIYFYSGGMAFTEAAPEAEVLRFYTAFAFQKVAGQSGGLGCKQLSESLAILNRLEEGALQLPCSKDDIVRAPTRAQQ